MPAKKLVMLLKSSIERKKEQDLKQMWLAMLANPFFDMEEGGSFKKFKQNYIVQRTGRGTNKTADEIEDEMSAVIAVYEQRKASEANGTV